MAGILEVAVEEMLDLATGVATEKIGELGFAVLEQYESREIKES